MNNEPIDVDKLDAITKDDELWQRIGVTDLYTERLRTLTRALTIDMYVHSDSINIDPKGTLSITESIYASSTSWMMGTIVGMVYVHRHGLPSKISEILDILETKEGNNGNHKQATGAGHDRQDNGPAHPRRHHRDTEDKPSRHRESE